MLGLSPFSLLFLCCVIHQSMPQGVFIHPVTVGGKTKLEFIKLEQELDFDVHDDSQFQSADDSKFEFPLTDADLEWLNSLFVFPNESNPRVRKEYRLLSGAERDRFHSAIISLKKDQSVSLNKYDLLANIHSRPSTNTAAHGGPAFLGWHRVFLLLMENALRQVDPNITIPYWDCTLDASMDVPAKSVLWSDSFLGNGYGPIKEGPFKNWDTHFGFGPLYREVSAQRKLLSHDDIKVLMQQKYIADISYPGAPSSRNVEQLHNNIHVWVGGLMKKIEIGAFDPVFYVLHSFIDELWEEFRSNQRMKGVKPESDYPKYYGRSSHAPFAPMGLGNFVAVDGISDIWARGIRYLPRPSCNSTHQNCGSKYLFCDKVKWRCVSKEKDERNDEIDVDKVSKISTTKSQNQSTERDIENIEVNHSSSQNTIYTKFGIQSWHRISSDMRKLETKSEKTFYHSSVFSAVKKLENFIKKYSHWIHSMYWDNDD